jgi:hypothetical protein
LLRKYFALCVRCCGWWLVAGGIADEVILTDGFRLVLSFVTSSRQQAQQLDDYHGRTSDLSIDTSISPVVM